MGDGTTDVLVVDDQPDVCRMIARAIDRHSIACVTTTDPGEAQKRLLEQDFALIITDVSMPGITGMELLHLARRRRPGTDVILITGRGSIEQAKEALRAGALDYLEKPLDLGHLGDLVQQVLARESGASAEFASPESLIHQHAERDALTGLLTLRAMHEKLAEIRLTNLANRQSAALIILNVDAFAEINGIFGYAFGDELLRQVAFRLRGKCGGRTYQCRCGADHFGIILPDADECAARNLAEQLRLAIGRMELNWKGHPVHVAVSAGLADTPAGFAMTEGELVERARAALLAAKRGGGNTVRSYSEIQMEGAGRLHLAAGEIGYIAAEAEKLNQRLQMACLESVRALATAVEAKDPYTHRHSEQVAYYAEQLARYLNLPGDVVESTRVGALVHDIGKISIPDGVLTKPKGLTDEEFALVRQHPEVGAGILEKISLLSLESHIVRHHHENWDGSGYPAGLAGEDIPLGARIVRVADSIDAMLMNRTYKPAYPVDRVLHELEACAGRDFEPRLAEAAARWMRENLSRLIQPRQQAG